MPRQTKRAAETAANEEMVVETAANTQANTETETVAAPAEKVRYQVKSPDLKLSDYVTVRNGFNGKLVYKSRKTGEKFVWSEFGAEQDMELAELKNAKNASKVFFENNWFLFDDPAVISFLGVDRLYKNALNFDEFDDLFKMKPAEIKSRISLLSEGQKYSVRYRARQMIADGAIDSIKIINALEEALGTELIER